MHVSVVPPVSSVTVVAPQPGAEVTPAWSYDQVTVTFDLNHPLHPPPLHDGTGVDAAKPTSGTTAHAAATTSVRQTSRAELT